MARRLADKIKLVVGSSLLGDVFLFLTKVLFVRLASLVVYGLYRQVLLVLSLAVSIFQGGLPKSVYYFFPTLKGTKRRKFVTQSLGLLFASGMLVWLGLYFFSGIIAKGYFHQPELGSYIRIIAWWAPFFLAYALFNPLLISSGKEELASGISITESMISNLGVVLIYFFTRRLDMTLWYLVAVGIVRFSFMMYYFWSRGLLGGLQIDRKLIKQQMGHALPLTFSKLARTWASNMDRLLISFFLSAGQFAIYSIGASSLPFVNSVTHTVNRVLMPRYVALLQQGQLDGFRCLWHKAIGKTARVIFPVFVFLFIMAGPLIRGLYSARYVSSVNIFRIYLLSIPLYFTGYEVVLRAVNRTGVILRYTLLFVVANLLISLLLFKLLGMPGPALGTVICNYGLSGFYLLSVCRVTGLSLRQALPYRELAQVFGVALFSGVLLLPVLSLQPGDVWQVITGAFWFGLCYIACGHMSGVTPWSEVCDLVHIR